MPARWVKSVQTGSAMQQPKARAPTGPEGCAVSSHEVRSSLAHSADRSPWIAAFFNRTPKGWTDQFGSQQPAGRQRWFLLQTGAG